ncbi:MAG: ABC transporter ATP-binding protein [Nitrososphaerota archaeon]
MIDIIDVTKSFLSVDNSRLQVLLQVNFHVNRGEFFTILGPNGCGKTTLLKIIHGLLAPDSGSVLIQGRPVSLRDKTRSFMFQSLNLVPWKTVWDNIALPLVLMGQNKSEIKEKINKIIEFMGLNCFEKHYPHQLSGGMQQKVAIARALVTDPQILLMDEPLSALDAYTREVLQDEILQIIEKRGLTVLYVTHSVDEALLLSDRICILTPRPARIKDIVAIDLPKPRRVSLKNTQEFSRLRKIIWDKLFS